MKTFQEHLAIIYDEHLIAEMSPKSNICDVPIGKLRSPLMKQMHKDKCGENKKEKDSPMHRAAKRAGMSRKNRDTLYNEREQ